MTNHVVSSLPPLAEPERQIAERISAARADQRTIEGGSTGLGLDGAYRIQAARRADRMIRGRKVGMVSPAKLAQFEMTEPIHGPVYEEMLLESPLSLERFVQPRLEPELAILLSADVGPAADPGEVAAAIPGLFLAVDVLDTIWEQYKCRPPEAVADNLNGGGFLTDDRLLPLTADGQLSLSIDGEELTAGPVVDLGDPIARVAWLAGLTGGLAAGQFVFLGSPSANVPARPGTLEIRGPEGSMLVARLEP
jgi:2-keto-4-pentenoate hydratase